MNKMKEPHFILFFSIETKGLYRLPSQKENITTVFRKNMGMVLI